MLSTIHFEKSSKKVIEVDKVKIKKKKRIIFIKATEEKHPRKQLNDKKQIILCYM